MSYLPELEPKNTKQAAVYTTAITALLLLAFTFITIFKTVDPPVQDYGIEVNLGTSDIGFGNSPSDIPDNNNEAAAPSPTPAEDNNEPEKIAVPKEKAPEKVIKAVEKPVVSEAEKSEVLKENKKKEKTKKEEIKKEIIKKPEPKVENKPVTKPAEVSKPKPVVAPKPDAGSLYSKPTTKPGTGGTGTGTKGGSEGNGKPGEIGDKGVKGGTPNAPLYSGNPGSGGNGGGGNGTGGASSSLNLAGWRFSKKPVINDNSDEVGFIKFEIKVDENGDLISIKPISYTVSLSLVNIYKRAIEKVSFEPTNNGTRQAISTGTINIKINPRN